ncbi:MAG: 50S ribosomal protein L22 [Verrucomicrobia bacterium]|nr:50S ribosomal protein L22 [Verrucomicrobiota bacterium]
MADYRAITRFVRISPRKARLAAALMRGLPVSAARLQLQSSGLKGGRLLIKTLDSAVANAELQSDTSAEKLSVQEVRVDEGPRLKRAKPRSRGQRHAFVKRTSHFTVVVSAKG